MIHTVINGIYVAVESIADLHAEKQAKRVIYKRSRISKSNDEFLERWKNMRKFKKKK